jgi:tetratricopeptide (TPR) repeat protein
VGIPGLLLLLTELGLRLGGYGYSTRFWDPAHDGRSLTTNPHFAWQFYSPETATAPTPWLATREKPPGTQRIVVLGESAAAGTPDPAFGFARMLELMLQGQYPGHRFEVVNAAMRGINSHIVLPITRECAQLSPDLLLIYMGNNEVIGLHSPTPGQINFTPYLRLLRLGQAMRSTRLAQLVRSITHRLGLSKAGPKHDMEYLRGQRLAFDDPARAAIYGNFRENLGAIVRSARRSGAKAIVATVASNLRDFPPLGSLHRTDLSPAQQADWDKAYAAGAAAESAGKIEEAIAHYQAAGKIDDHFAELHFRLARACEAAGKSELAARHYRLGRDWDALQFRSDSRINQVIRQRAAESHDPGVKFADVEKAFAESPLAAPGTPGGSLFHDHVHFTFDGDYLVARSLLPHITESLGLPAATHSVPSRDDCARTLAYTALDELNVITAMVQQMSRPPFLDQLEHASRQAAAEKALGERRARVTTADFDPIASIYQAALAQRPDDWMLRYNHGNMLGQFNQYPAAAAEYEFVVKQLPRQRSFRVTLGNALLQSGRAMEALAQFHAALEIDPNFAPARDAIAAARRRRPAPANPQGTQGLGLERGV